MRGLRLGIISASGSEPSAGLLPTNWSPDDYWESDTGFTGGASLSNWESKGLTTRDFDTVSNPSIVDPDVDFNNEKSVSFDGSAEYLFNVAAGWSLVDQRYFHDNTTDWEILIVGFVFSGVSSGVSLMSNGKDASRTGINLSDDGGRLRCTIMNGTTTTLTCTGTTSSLTYDQAMLVRLTYVQATRTLTLTIDDTVPASAVGSGTVDTGDAGSNLFLGARWDGASAEGYMECKIASVFISKTIANPATVLDQITYYNDKYGTTA